MSSSSCTAARAAEPIDQHALVTRHNIRWDSLSGEVPLGNGEFCFNADGTGLQTFGGNTMSQWGWHSFPIPGGLSPADLRLEMFDTYGREVGYATNSKGQEPLFNWLR